MVCSVWVDSETIVYGFLWSICPVC